MITPQKTGWEGERADHATDTGWEGERADHATNAGRVAERAVLMITPRTPDIDSVGSLTDSSSQ